MRIQNPEKGARLSHGMSSKARRSASFGGENSPLANLFSCRRPMRSRSGMTACAKERMCSHSHSIYESGTSAPADAGAATVEAATLNPSILRLAMNVLEKLQKGQCESRQPHRPRLDGEQRCHRSRQLCGSDNGGSQTRSHRCSDTMKSPQKRDAPPSSRKVHGSRVWNSHPYFFPTYHNKQLEAHYSSAATATTSRAPHKSLNALFAAKSANTQTSLESSSSTALHVDIVDPKVPRQVLRESLPSTIGEETLINMILDACSDEHGSVALGDMLPFLTSAKDGDAEGGTSLNVLSVTNSSSLTRAYFRVFLLLEARQYPVDDKMCIMWKSLKVANLTADSPWLLFAEQLFFHLPRFPRQLLYSTGPLGEERIPPKECSDCWDSWSTAPPVIQHLPLLQVWPVIMFPRFVVLMTRWGKKPIDVLRELQLSRSSSQFTALFPSRRPTTVENPLADTSQSYFATSHPYYDEDTKALGKNGSNSLRTESGAFQIPTPPVKASRSIKRINSFLNAWNSESDESVAFSCSSQVRQHYENSLSRSRQLNESVFSGCASPADVLPVAHTTTKVTGELKLRLGAGRKPAKTHMMTVTEHGVSSSYISPPSCLHSSTFISPNTTTNTESSGTIDTASTIITEKLGQGGGNGFKETDSHCSCQCTSKNFTSRLHSAVESGRELNKDSKGQLHLATDREALRSTLSSEESRHSFPPFPSFPVLPTTTQVSDLPCSLLQRSHGEHDLGPRKTPSHMSPSLPLPIPFPPLLSLTSSPMKSLSGGSSEPHMGSMAIESMKRARAKAVPGTLEEQQINESFLSTNGDLGCTDDNNWTLKSEELVTSLSTDNSRKASTCAPQTSKPNHHIYAEFGLLNRSTDTPIARKVGLSPTQLLHSPSLTCALITEDGIARKDTMDLLYCLGPIPLPLTQLHGECQRNLLGVALLLQLTGRGYLARRRAASARRDTAAIVLRRIFEGFATRQYLHKRQMIKKKTDVSCQVSLMAAFPSLQNVKVAADLPCIRLIKNGKLAFTELSVASIFVFENGEISHLPCPQKVSTPNDEDETKEKMVENRENNTRVGILQQVGRGYISRKKCPSHLFKNSSSEAVEVRIETATNPIRTETQPTLNVEVLDDPLMMLRPTNELNFLQDTSNTGGTGRRRSSGVTFVACEPDVTHAEVSDLAGNLSQATDMRRESLHSAWNMRNKRHVDYQGQNLCQHVQQQQHLLLLRDAFDAEERNTDRFVAKRPKTPVGFLQVDDVSPGFSDLWSAPRFFRVQESVTPPEAFLRENRGVLREAASGLPPLTVSTGCMGLGSHTEEIFLSEVQSSVCYSNSLSAVPSCCFFSSSTRSALSVPHSVTPNTAVLRELDIAFPFENVESNEADEDDDKDEDYSESTSSSLSSGSEGFQGYQNGGTLPEIIVPAGITDHTIISEGDATLLIQRLGRGFARRKHLHFSLLLAVSWFEISVLHRAAAGYFHRKQLGYRYHATLEAQRELQRFYYRNQSAMNIQRMLRGFLARQRTKKLQRKLWVRIELYVALEQQELYEEG